MGQKSRSGQSARTRLISASWLTIIAMAGCHAEGTRANPRISTSPPGPTTPLPSSATAHDEVLAAYQEYWKVLAEAGRSTPENARTLLSARVSGKYLKHLLKGVTEMRSHDREPYGQVVPRVKEVWVSQGRARVADCQDVSNAAMADAITHKRIPQSGSAKTTANVEATLVQTRDGRWLLTGVTVKEAPCTPPSP